MNRWSLLALILAALAVIGFVSPAAPEGDAGTAVFELRGNAKILHYHGTPGTKAFRTKVNMKNAALCIQGTAQGCAGNINVHAGGKAYLFYDGTSSWRIDTDPTGATAITLTGIVGTDGRFAMTGTDATSQSLIAIQGKVKYEKDKITPRRIFGSLTAASNSQEHLGLGKFKTGDLVP